MHHNIKKRWRKTYFKFTKYLHNVALQIIKFFQCNNFRTKIFKESPSLISGLVTLIDNALRTIRWSKWCNKNWQLWLLSLVILCLLVYTQRDIFDAYPSGTLTRFNTLRRIFLSLWPIENVLGGKYVLLYCPFC